MNYVISVTLPYCVVRTQPCVTCRLSASIGITDTFGQILIGVRSHAVVMQQIYNIHAFWGVKVCPQNRLNCIILYRVSIGRRYCLNLLAWQEVLQLLQRNNLRLMLNSGHVLWLQLCRLLLYLRLVRLSLLTWLWVCILIWITVDWTKNDQILCFIWAVCLHIIALPWLRGCYNGRIQFITL